MKSYLGYFASVFPHNRPYQVEIVRGKSQAHAKSKEKKGLVYIFKTEVVSISSFIKLFRLKKNNDSDGNRNF